MLKTQGYRQAVNTIADRIAPIEEAFDDAIELQASLLAETPAIRRRAGVQPQQAQDAMARMSAAIAHTVQARSEFLEAHAAFAAAYDRIGIDVLATGSPTGCPKTATLAPSIAFEASPAGAGAPA